MICIIFSLGIIFSSELSHHVLEKLEITKRLTFEQYVANIC